MPLVQWACPEHKEEKFGESHPAEYCILECDDQCMSPSLIAALTHREETNHHFGLYISATALSGCVRKLKLERTVPFSDYMKNRMYGYRGTVIHQIAEDAATYPIRIKDGKISLEELGFLSEHRMLIGFCFEHGGFTVPKYVDANDESTWKKVRCRKCKKGENNWFLLGGTLDSAAPLWETFDPEIGTLEMSLWDLKTLGDYPLGKFIMGDETATLHSHIKDDYVIQANLYAYLAEICKLPKSLKDLGVRRIVFTGANIQGFGMNDFPRSGTSNRYRSQKTGWKEKDFEIPEIPIFEKDFIIEYIKERARPIYEALILDTSRGTICPPESNKKGEHSWICRFCAFEGNAEYCPDPSQEWQLLQEGISPDVAFTVSQET